MTAQAPNQSWSPDWAVHPGDLLEEHLEARELSQAEFARRAGLTPKLVSTILTKKNPVTPETAIAFERVLGVRDYIWTNLQAEWDLKQVRAEELSVALEPRVREWMELFPVKEMQKRGVLPRTKVSSDLYSAILRFFGVASIAGYEARFGRLSVQYRHSPTHRSKPACLHAWLQFGENAARELELEEYDAEKFTQALVSVRSLTNDAPDRFFPRMVELCRHAGVAVVAVKPLPQTRLSGAARWISERHALIQLSLRHKTNDHFWFSFFHEAGHILLHKRSTIFADDDSGLGDSSEEEADKFAEDILVGSNRFASFAASLPSSRAEVMAFAEEVGVHPGIVVGMLQHRRVLAWSHLNGLKQKFAWSDEA